MKHLKRIVALLLAAIMILAMGAGVFADGDTPADNNGSTPAYDHPLTVTGLKKDDTAKFYKIVEWVGEAEGNVAGWKAIDPYSTVLTPEVLKAVLLGDKTADPVVEPTGITSALAGALAKLAGEDGKDGTVAEGTATYDNEDSGMWMVLVTPADANTIYNPVFVSADYMKEVGGTVAIGGLYSGDAVAKSSTVDLSKTAETTEDAWDDNKPNTTAVGDEVTFTVTATIPAYGEVYEKPHFKVTDTLTGLELVTGSVTIVAPEGLKDHTDYELADNEDLDGFTLTLTHSYLKTVKAPTTLTITYKAIVTQEAVYAINEENNEVKIEYSHDPLNEDDYDVKKDTTQHYTFSLDAEGIAAGESTVIKGKKTSEVVKIGVDAAGNPITEIVETSMIGDPEVDKWESPLAGAVFGLFTDAACENPYLDKNGNAVTAETGADGRMNFAGLDAGTYYLKEISAPAGFVTNSQAHKVEIIAEVETVTVTEWWNGSEWVSEKPTEGTAKEVTYETEILKSYTVKIDDKEIAKYTFTNNTEPTSPEIQWEEAELIEHPYQLVNTQGLELPSTGGMGTTILYIVGGILVLGAAVLLIVRRRMNVI